MGHEKTDHAQYQAAVLQVVSAACLLAAHPIDELLAAIARAEAIGPIVDPTLYRDKVGAMLEDKRVLEAALPMWRLGREMTARRAEQLTQRRLSAAAGLVPEDPERGTPT